MNYNVLAAAVAMCCAGGILMFIDGSLKRVPNPKYEAKQIELTKIMRTRLYRAIGAALITLVITRWPALSLGAAFGGWFSFELLGGKTEREFSIAITEAIASWTEMLRDTLTAAHGLEAAISSTAAIAPDAIKDEVAELVIRMQKEPLDVALVNFGKDLAHPIGDLVVTALTLAAGGSSRDLAELLGTLAASARDDANLRMRIDAARARSRSSVRIITSMVGIMALVMPVVSQGYLKAFNTTVGQIVLLVVCAIWGAAFVIIRKMGQVKPPERFLARSEQDRLSEAGAV